MIKPNKGEYWRIISMPGEGYFFKEKVIKVENGIVYLLPINVSRIHGRLFGYLKCPLENFLERYKKCE